MAGRAQKMIARLLRWIVAGVFLYAGAIKALDPAQFAADVENFQLLPYAAACATGLYLPWLEIVAALALATGIWRAGASLLLGGMLCVFLAALGSAWARGLDITCGCFGHAANKTNYPLALFIDLALLAALLAIEWRSLRRFFSTVLRRQP